MNNTRLLNILNTVYKLDPDSRWDDVYLEKESAVKKLTGPHPEASKIIYINPDSDAFPDKTCNLHGVEFLVDISPTRTVRFPNDYDRRLSFLMSKNQRRLYARISKAMSTFHNYGFVGAISSQNQKYFKSKYTRRLCEERYRTKLRVPAYDEPMGRIGDLTTLLLVLCVGYVVGGGVWLVECCRGSGNSNKTIELENERKWSALREYVEDIRRNSRSIDVLYDKVFASK